MKKRILKTGITLFSMLFFINSASPQTFKIVDTGQEKCYDNTVEMTPPAEGQVFYGQDAQYDGCQPSYTDNGDGTLQLTFIK